MLEHERYIENPRVSRDRPAHTLSRDLERPSRSTNLASAQTDCAKSSHKWTTADNMFSLSECLDYAIGHGMGNCFRNHSTQSHVHPLLWGMRRRNLRCQVQVHRSDNQASRPILESCPISFIVQQWTSSSEVAVLLCVCRYSLGWGFPNNQYFLQTPSLLPRLANNGRFS